MAIWVVLSINTPPIARFSSEAVDLRLLVSAEASRDPDGPIVSYNWDWGDGSFGSGVRAAHNYAREGTYTVALTVTDNRGATNTTNQTVVIQVLPTAFFIARHDRMTVSFNASQSFVSTGEAITAYGWDFGDGNTATGPVVQHTYAEARRYTVTLTVTDEMDRQGTAIRYVSPADTTVDILMHELFTANCPFRDYWPVREGGYGDVILENGTVCTSYYPYIYFSASPSLQTQNPSWLYTLYLLDARVRNHPGYSLEDPVLLPVLNPLVAPETNSFIRMNITLEYMDIEMLEVLSQTDWAVSTAFDDGWGYLVRGTITMDLAMSKRIFGVASNVTTPADAEWWWSSNTIPGNPRGTAERDFDSWLNTIGGVNGKYDIANAFEWFFQSDVTDLNATVDPTTAETTVQVFMTGWGYEVLLARWFYWGPASYKDAVNSAYGEVEPRGWMPMEYLWGEDVFVNATIMGRLDLDLRAVHAYHLNAAAVWGEDETPGTGDDLPSWSLAPILIDYVPGTGSASPGASAYPNSELRWYEGLRAIHYTPGSYGYGQALEYSSAPAEWTLNPGSTLTMVLPRIEVPWYDPARSRWDPDARIGEYVTFNSPMTLRYICSNPDLPATCSSDPQGAYYTWDPRAKILALAGPHDWGNSGLLLQPSPWIDFAPEAIP